MAGGGKGGSTTQETSQTIDPRLEEAGLGMLERAKLVSQLGYQPNRNVQVAAFTPMQEAAFQNQSNAMNAFGMAAPSDPMAGMPEAQRSGSGILGYGFGDEYDAAMAGLPSGYRKAIQGMFIDPKTGAAPAYAQEAEAAPSPSAGKGGHYDKGGGLGSTRRSDNISNDWSFGPGGVVPAPYKANSRGGF